MWGNLKSWLPYGAIADDDELAADLTGPTYSFAIRQGRDVIALERKEDMRSRGLRSSDLGDALALTLAHHFAPRDQEIRQMRTKSLLGPGARSLLRDPYEQRVNRNAEAFADRFDAAAARLRFGRY